MTADSGHVRYERRGTTAFITFDRPSARNALTWSMYEQLASILERLETSHELRVVVLRGAGGSFVAGTDIAQFTDFTSADDGVEYERRLETVVGRLEALPIPTIAVVEGHAVGGGLALASVCDLRICTLDARFSVPIARTVGNCLSTANCARLVMHLGVARTKQLLFLGESLSASDALSAGFVVDAVEPAVLDSRVEELCARIASHAPVTLRVTKEAMRRIVASVASDGEDLTRNAYGSRDFHEGVAAFLGKRAPNWEGR
jgi:enoyl-CoA hydratase/carnithine racemase